jgi:hypothetical protein
MVPELTVEDTVMPQESRYPDSSSRDGTSPDVEPGNFITKKDTNPLQIGFKI